MKKDFALIAQIYTILLILTFSGVMIIYSSRRTAEHDASVPELAFRQFGYIIIGFIILELIRRIKKEHYIKYADKLFYAGLLLLFGVLLFGVRINGMKGWYSFFYFHIQPSEIFKFIYVLFISKLYIDRGTDAKNFAIAAMFTAICSALIVIQPDYGTASIYFFSFAIISFLAGVKIRYLILLPLAGITGLLLFIVRKQYGFNRLYGFFSDNADIAGSAWHWKQFQLSIARGSWFGTKIDGSFWSNNYLPFAYNDSAYAALHETIGFAGGLLILSLFFVLFFLIIRRSCNTGKYSLISKAAISTLLIHALLHCSVNSALLPTTGLTLPFVSYGGSSLLGAFLLTGLAIAFCRSEETENDNCNSEQ